MENKRILPEGFRVTTQSPIDDRHVFKTIAALIDLGVNNQNAYRYHEGMMTYCIENRSEYVWRESATGALATSFTYPANIVANGITYSGRAFNFFVINEDIVLPEINVFADQNDPNTGGTIFTDIDGNVVVGGDSAVLYIGLNSSTWTFKTFTNSYVTFTAPVINSTPWFIQDTLIDAGGNKTTAISRVGTVKQGSSTDYNLLNGRHIQVVGTDFTAAIRATTYAPSSGYSVFDAVTGRSVSLYSLSGSALSSYRTKSINNVNNAEMRSVATENHSNTTLGTRTEFYTTPNGSNVSRVALELGEDKSVKISNAYKLPTTDGTANQMLKTDGSGELTWVDKPIGESNFFLINTLTDAANAKTGGIERTGGMRLNQGGLTITNNTETGTYSANSIILQADEGLLGGGNSAISMVTHSPFQGIFTKHSFSTIHGTKANMLACPINRNLFSSSVGTFDGVAFVDVYSEMVTSTDDFTQTEKGVKKVFRKINTNEASLSDILEFTGAGNIKFNGAYSFPKVAGTADQVMQTNGFGVVSWATVGNVVGSGTNNYLSKWTPDGTTLGNSQIRDDGTNIGIGAAPTANVLLQMYSATLDQVVNVVSVANNSVAISAQTSGGGVSTWGIIGHAQGAALQKVGVRGSSSSDVGNASVGGHFTATGAGTNHAIRLQDGTEATGRFLKSVTPDGKANWAQLTKSDITNGISGSGINNRLARWTPDGTTLGVSLLQDNGTHVGIGVTPGGNTLFSLQNSTVQFGMHVMTTMDNPRGISAEAVGGGSSAIGITGYAQGSASIKQGVFGIALSDLGNIAIGGFFRSEGLGTNYSLRLVDGTEATGRFLKSVTSDGKANWAELTTSDVSGSITGTGVLNKIAFWAGPSTLSHDSGISVIPGANPGIGILGQNSSFSVGETMSLTSNSYSQFNMNTFSDSLFPLLTLQRKRGTLAAATDTLSGDTLGLLRWSGGRGISATIQSIATENQTAGNSGGMLRVQTTSNGGTNSTTRFEIDQNGTMAFGGASFDAAIQMRALTTLPSGLVFTNTHGGTTNTVAISGVSSGVNTGVNNTGTRGIASGNPTKNIGVNGIAQGVSALNVGVHAVASGGTLNYAIQLQDGTEGVGKFLRCATADGKAEWANIDFSIPQSQNIYVDSEYGVNSAGRGDINKPYLTIEYALATTINTGTITATTTTNNNTLSAVSDTALIKVGQFITGTGIPYNSHVVSKTGNTIVLSKTCTATASITATWWTTYNVICVGSFTVLSNIYKHGFYIDAKTYNATINFGAFVLFQLMSNSVIPVGFKLGKTNGTHANSQLHTTGGFSGITANLDHGNYYTIGTGLQYGNSDGHFNYSGDVNIEGVFFDCRFGSISLFGIGGIFNWNSDAYALLGGVRGGGAIFSTVKGNITTPASISAILSIGTNYAVYGNIKGSVLMNMMTIGEVGSIYANISGTTVTLNGGNVGKINMFGSIVGNVAASGVVGLYGFVDGTITSSGNTVTCTTIFNGSSGIINVGDSIVIYEYASPTYGTLSNTINISTGTFINKGQVRGNFSFTGNGKYINNGTVFPGLATNSPPASVISNGGSFINNPTGVVRYDGNEVACLMTKLNGILVNNGRMVNKSKLYVNYSANTSASKDIIIQNSFTNGNGSNGGVGKGTGNILSLLVTSAGVDTSADIFDGTNTVTISVVGAGKTSDQISNEFVALIEASVLLYQFTAFTGFRFYFIGLQSITTTATTLVNLTSTLYNVGGGLSFVPNILVAGTEINNSNLNY